MPGPGHKVLKKLGITETPLWNTGETVVRRYNWTLPVSETTHSVVVKDWEAERVYRDGGAGQVSVGAHRAGGWVGTGRAASRGPCRLLLRGEDTAVVLCYYLHMWCSSFPTYAPMTHATHMLPVCPSFLLLLLPTSPKHTNTDCL